jgi:4-oxalocrotonate tautomerase
MPLVEINTIKGVFNKTQKEEMIKKVTDAMVSVEGENMRPVTWVVIREIESGEWGIGGKPLHIEDIKAMAAAKK